MVVTHHTLRIDLTREENTDAAEVLAHISRTVPEHARTTITATEAVSEWTTPPLPAPLMCCSLCSDLDGPWTADGLCEPCDAVLERDARWTRVEARA